MKYYIKNIDGLNIIKALKEIVIIKGDKQIFNPNEEVVLEDGWIEYIAPTTPELTKEELFNNTKKKKIKEIELYDSSNLVNECFILSQDNVIPYWANKSERSSLKSAVQDCIAMGRETYRLDLREVGVSVDINCEKLLSMLSALEVYAIDCYNKTTDHIYAVNTLTTVEEIEAYDYRVGYPEKLTFTLSLVE